MEWRKRLVALMAVLTCFGMLASVIAIWTHRTLLNTDAWMEVVGPLGEDPAVTDAVSSWSRRRARPGRRAAGPPARHGARC